MKMLSALLLLTFAFAPMSIAAHDLVDATGKYRTHQHVYRRGAYGEGLQQGHYARPPGSNGILIWGPQAKSNLGTATRPGMNIPRAHPGRHQPVPNLQRRLPATTDKNDYGSTR